MFVEAEKLGLPEVELLDQPTRKAVRDRTVAEWVADEERKAEADPTSEVHQQRREQTLRQRWPISASLRQQTIARLWAMINPEGKEVHGLPLRVVLMAARVLARFGRLAQAQQRLDVRLRNQPEPFDPAKAAAAMAESDRKRIEERGFEPVILVGRECGYCRGPSRSPTPSA
jgi:hypothetical protein